MVYRLFTYEDPAEFHSEDSAGAAKRKIVVNDWDSEQEEER